jgi:hypothetical protein
MTAFAAPPTLQPSHLATLETLRDIGPCKLSRLNEEAIDDCFKMRPRLVMIHTHHPTDPLIDITSDGLRQLAAAQRVVSCAG